MEGLTQCLRLNHLNLAHNNISKMENLDGLALRYLNLRGNKINVIENLDNLQWLQNINLSGNQISSLNGLQGHELLEVVDLEDNQIAYITEIKFIEDLKLLRMLNLLRNPIQNLLDYRRSLLFRLPQVDELDRSRAEIEEKVAAINLFNAPINVIAAHDHRKCMVYSFLKPAKVLASTLPTMDQPYPMLVLVGPTGSGKRELTHQLVEEFPEFFGYGIPHTTRAPQNGELESCDFRFISSQQFTTNLKQGNFVLTYEESGHSFGLTMDAIEDVAKEGLACVTHMELEGVLTLRLTYFEPRYILLLPLDKDVHKKRLQERGGFSELQIDHALARNTRYQDMNDQKPGFFDVTIDSTHLKDAYHLLRKLLMDYLGISCNIPRDVIDDSDSFIQDISDGSASTSELSNSRTQSRVTYTAEKPGTTNSGSGIRTWSRNTSDPGSLKVPQTIRMKMEPSKSSVEKASYERRKSAAKATASGGAIPSPIEQLNRIPRTAPPALQRDSDTPFEDKPPSPDSSEDDARSTSNFSNLSEARGFSAVQSPLSSQVSLDLGGVERLVKQASLSNSPLDFTGQSSHADSRASLTECRPSSGGSRPGSGRPGSERKPILPPITANADKSQPEY